jgi:hypothetical protein
MPDLTTSDVHALLTANGLAPQDDEDLDEITHRINAIHEALQALEPAGLDAMDPVVVRQDESAA